MDRVLIINDSPSINMMLQFRLEAENFAADTALTGKEGIEKVKKNNYQLLILDYGLPDIKGAEVCKIIRKDDSIQYLPIVYISAKDEDELARIVKETGADGYLSMPYAGNAFVDTIKKYILLGKEG